MHTDHVEKVDRHVLINAAREMPNWVVSRHRPTVITFEDRKYVVDQVRPLELGRVEYRLAPAEDSDLYTPGRHFFYDQAFVDAREEVILERRLTAPRDILLGLTSPLIGFLWTGTKARLQSMGFDVWSAQRGSLWIERVAHIGLLLAAFGELWLGYIFTFLGMLSLVVLLTLDLVLRSSTLIDEDADLLGLFEFLNPKRYFRDKSK